MPTSDARIRWQDRVRNSEILARTELGIVRDMINKPPEF